MGLPQGLLPLFPEKVLLVPPFPDDFKFRQFCGNRIEERSNLAFFVHNELLSIEQPVDIPGSRIPHPRDPFNELTDPVLGVADLLPIG